MASRSVPKTTDRNTGFKKWEVSYVPDLLGCNALTEAVRHMSLEHQYGTWKISVSIVLTISIPAPLRCTSSAQRSLDVMVEEAQSHFFGNTAT